MPVTTDTGVAHVIPQPLQYIY
eukprot:COSAG01_NODE_58583_length_305_cov_0.747573_2_plen_21_part_01